jgi:osmotically-inducible protein OsmY
MTQTRITNDRDLKAAIVEELAWTASVDSTHIGVSVDQGAVTLSGEVESYPERRLAEQAAMRVRGVTALAEEITVRSDWGASNDSDIARAAAASIDRAINVPDSVKASVHQHRITLSGSVPWHYQREAAMQAVRCLKGVDGVVNTITIKPTVATGNLKNAIVAAFVRNARLEASDVTITASSVGVVTLDGQVHTWPEREQAERLAWSAPGVTLVHNHLKIRP